MADRQASEFTSKSNNSRHSPHGISLANLSEPLSFGPALMPTLQPVGISSTVGTPSQSTASPSNTGALFPLEADDEADSFLGQQPSPQQKVSATTSHQKSTPVAPPFQSTPSTMSSFMSSVQQQQQQQSKTTGPRHFTMTGGGPDIDHFLTPTTQASSAASTSETPLHPAMSHTPSAQATLQAGYSHVPSRRAYPKVNPQLGYSQSNMSQSPSQSPQISSPAPLYQPPSQFPTPHQYTQGSQPLYAPATAPFVPSVPQVPPQVPPHTHSQQYGAFPEAPGEAPVLTVNQQTTPEVVPSILIAPVQPHWFYMKENRVWLPFSYIDSNVMEHASRSPVTGQDRIVPTNGGRYDVNIDKRTRESVYWEEPATVVRRCTWFYKGEGGIKLVPYVEEIAEKLENEFQTTVRLNLWPRRIDLGEGEYVILHNTNVLVHFRPGQQEWSGEDIKVRPTVVRRGVFDIEEEIEEGEPAQIDHLVFVIHGIGPIADLRFRNIVECVDDLRIVTLSMLSEHREELAHGRAIGRIEYLPVRWHAKLHDDTTGVDQRLHSISLQSITKLREFTNSTLLDILFYTSPTYCQTIVDTVGSEMKRLLALFTKRNPSFKGKVSVCGHSLGSSIMFDILFHQKDQLNKEVIPEPQSNSAPSNPQLSNTEVNNDMSDEEDTVDCSPSLEEVLSKLGLNDYKTLFETEKIDMDTLLLFSESDIKEIGLPMGPRKKIMGYLKQHAALQEKQEQRKAEKAKAKAEAKANDLHKIAQEERDILDNGSIQSLTAVESVEVLYHQGLAGTGQPFVKYPKLNFKPFAMFALGSPIGMFMTVRGVDQVGPDFQLPTCPRFYNIFHPFDPVAYKVEPIVDSTFALPPVMLPHHKGRKRMHLELRDNLTRFGASLKASLIESVKNTLESIHEFAMAHTNTSGVEKESEQPPTPTGSLASDSSEDDRARHELSIKIGQLNSGNRIDYVLQEKPIESLNEYLFALGSHVCYWLSEDTALFMLREIYKEEI